MTRWLLTVVAIIFISYLVGLFVKKNDLPMSTAVEGCQIDENYCIGCGFCVRKMPEYFRLENKKAILVSEEGLYDENNNEALQQVIEKCPTKAVLNE